MEVPIQCGDEEQCFWDSHGTAFEALGQTHHPKELSQTWGQAPSLGPLCSSAPGAAAPTVTGTTHTYGPWLLQHRSHPTRAILGLEKPSFPLLSLERVFPQVG